MLKQSFSLILLVSSFWASAQNQHNASVRYFLNSKNELRYGVTLEKEYSNSSFRFALDILPQKELILQPYSHYAQNTFEQLSFGVAWAPFKIAVPDKPISAKFFINASFQNRSYGRLLPFENRNVNLGIINFFDLYVSNQISYRFKNIAVFLEPSVGVRFIQNKYLNNFNNYRLHAFSLGASYLF